MRARSTHHRGISLRDILPEAEFGRTADIRLAACSTDANRCRPGDLFVALVEGDRDGHGQVRRAVAAGASAVVTERPVECGVPFCLVRDTHEAFAQICQALAGQPGQQLKTIGITGGTGRATTAYLAASVLEAGGLAAGIMGSLGYCDGVDSCPPESAHIRPTAAARWLGRMAANQCSHAVIEISPAALRRSALSGVEFDVISVAGQLGRNNSDPNSPGEGELLQSRLVDLMRPEGLAVLEATGATSESILSVLHGPALTVGLEAPAEITASLLEQSASEQLFLLHAGDESVPVRTTLVGQRNLRHCLLAAGIGLAYEIELAAIVRGLENVHRIPGRLERLECGQPFAAFVDDAGSPSAVKNSLQELRPLTGGKLIVVCGAEGECRESQRPWLGRTLSQHAESIVLTSDNPRQESPAAICRQIDRGIPNKGQRAIILDRTAAIHHALSQAQPGDCVLVAGKGNQDHQIIGQQRHPWDDREVVCECLYQQAFRRPITRAA